VTKKKSIATIAAAVHPVVKTGMILQPATPIDGSIPGCAPVEYSCSISLDFSAAK